MALKNAIFLFEVVVDSVKSFVESRSLVIRSEFADIFSLELKDPKQMYIVMPEPLPLPPEPPGKKGKKKKKPPKPKKGKKGKKGKGKVEEPPPEPVIQSGQSVLFSSTAEFLIQNMKKHPLEVSLWSKEDNLVFIGTSVVPWDPVFLLYLERICNCEEPMPAVVRDEYNVFQEGTAKLMAKLGMQVKLTYLTNKVVSAFRTLSEDPSVRKVLYTGMNSKTTSYMCTLKTTEEEFQEKISRIENSYIKDKPKIPQTLPMVYADYTNAPGANLTNYKDDEYCCKAHADKPPENKYKAPETCPDIDFIIDYVRKIIKSCNDNLRMLTPRPTIRPRIKATDIDRLCYCRESSWPQGKLAERFRKEVQGAGCPLCVNATKTIAEMRANTFDIANLRGPCGRPDCRIARDLRGYIENLVAEDKIEVNINEIIGPCGSKSCTLTEKIQDFLRHEGEFTEGLTEEGLSTQCACIEKMQKALNKREVCDSECSKDCENSSSETSQCGGKGCPYGSSQRVYQVYYFNVEYDTPLDKSPQKSPNRSPSPTNTSKSSATSHKSGISTPMQHYKHCSDFCSVKMSAAVASCSKNVCTPFNITKPELKCVKPVCSNKDESYVPSPADSDIVICLDDINNPCCVKSCDIAERVKEFIVDGELNKKKILPPEDDPCYCDCECTFKLSSRTTYCAICGGYECLGDDVREQPDYAKPHPCPIYHKLYDRETLKVIRSAWPEEDEARKQQQVDGFSTKSSKTNASKSATPGPGKGALPKGSSKPVIQKTQEKSNKTKEKKKVGKFTANVTETTGTTPSEPKKPEAKHYHPVPVPKNMGWLWTAEDIPGMKPRPKWRPGAANKILVRRYRTVREGVDNIAKKKRALLQRKKKIEMKPTLVVKKKDGEYTVQMEVFKKYSKERLLFQYPYEETTPLIYTIGKTEEEKIKIRKQRERRERRETRRKCRLLQSTFRDKCQEICLKAYNQAMGLLPLPNLNNPECPCDLEALKPPSPPIDSCSCSDECSISTSDTDGDEWIIEFTPPLARWDPKAKHPPTLSENESQYSYLDYKVKVLDKQGNPVPRFFKGPDGKQECSDLGGFWGPGHQWLEIGKDGYIGLDNRWVPLNFIGPDGMFYLSEEGFFTDQNGKNWKIGVDGYIDKDGKWAWYSKKKGDKPKSMSSMTATTDTKKTGKENHKTKVDAKGKHTPVTPVTSSPKRKSDDKKSSPGPTNATKGNNKDNKTAFKAAKSTVVNLAFNHSLKGMQYGRKGEPNRDHGMKYKERQKLYKYQEIMNDLPTYDGGVKQMLKMNRASNTPRRKISPFTVDNCCRNIRQPCPMSHKSSDVKPSTSNTNINSLGMVCS